MPTTQKPQQKQTKATQKVGGSAKKPVTKTTEDGKSKIAAVKSKTTTRGGSVKGDSVKTYATKPRQHIGGGASKTVKKGPSTHRRGGGDDCFNVTQCDNGNDNGNDKCYKVNKQKCGVNSTVTTDNTIENNQGEAVGVSSYNAMINGK